MKTHDEIKRGLELCNPQWKDGHWKTCDRQCPYTSEMSYCRNVLHSDVLAYIRKLEARVAEHEKPLKPMTWEEAMMDDFFLEIRGDDCIDGALNDFAVDGDEGYMWISTRNRAEDESKLMRADYGRLWRGWPRRPTEEERKAAEWDG